MSINPAPDRGAAAADLVITRVLNAPRALVFRVWSEAEHLARWWGPKGAEIRVERLDFRPGGLFHYCQRMADGGEIWGRFVYHEILAPERIVYVSSFSDAEGAIARNPWSPTWPLEIHNTLTLAEDAGKTTLTLRGGPLNATEAEIATFTGARPMVQQGFAGTIDQLEAYLAQA